MACILRAIKRFFRPKHIYENDPDGNHSLYDSLVENAYIEDDVLLSNSMIRENDIIENPLDRSLMESDENIFNHPYVEMNDPVINQITYNQIYQSPSQQEGYIIRSPQISDQ